MCSKKANVVWKTQERRRFTSIVRLFVSWTTQLQKNELASFIRAGALRDLTKWPSREPEAHLFSIWGISALWKSSRLGQFKWPVTNLPSFFASIIMTMPSFFPSLPFKQATDSKLFEVQKLREILHFREVKISIRALGTLKVFENVCSMKIDFSHYWSWRAK